MLLLPAAGMHQRRSLVKRLPGRLTRPRVAGGAISGPTQFGRCAPDAAKSHLMTFPWTCVSNQEFLLMMKKSPRVVFGRRLLGYSSTDSLCVGVIPAADVHDLGLRIQIFLQIVACRAEVHLWKKGERRALLCTRAGAWPTLSTNHSCLRCSKTSQILYLQISAHMPGVCAKGF